MISTIQALILGALQGITELFPISSLGHSVIFPQLFGWNISQDNNKFLIFLVITHLATALVLFGFFWNDWVNIISGTIRSLKNREITPDNVAAKIGWLLVVSTIPAGVLGLLLEQKLKHLLSSGKIVAGVLILNGVLLYIAEFLRKKSALRHQARSQETYSDAAIATLTWLQATKIGLMQTLALIPGFSRTGSTLSGGLFVGLSHADSARFSFLLATPIIFAAAVAKLPELITTVDPDLIKISIIGAFAASVAAFFSIKFLTKYFETKTLNPFALYCIVAGTLFLFFFNLR